MMAIGLYLTLLLPVTLFSQENASPFQADIRPINQTEYAITLSVDIPPRDALYADYLTITSDNPDVSVSSWTASTQPIPRYDQTFKEIKKLFEKPFTISLTATTSNPNLTDAHLVISYYQRSKKKMALARFSFPTVNTEQSPTLPNDATKNQESAIASKAPAACISEPSALFAPAAYFSRLLQTASSFWIQLLLSLVLGILLSLTPCIYPMIPITIGILQAQKSSSLLRSLSLALAYTGGIATTFALLGLSAALTGSLFGNIMTNPFVIGAIVLLLVYLGLSMMGLYEMRLPRFLQHANVNARGGSLSSAFMFGAASGTVASPCLSPGLVLLLSIVTTMGSYLKGFALLFCFGVGLGLPLLIIGAFSSAIHVLPKAGMWMVEVKRLFGLLMLAMSFYFLRTMLTPQILAWSGALFCFAAGLYELFIAQKVAHTWRVIHQALGIALIAFSIVLIACPSLFSSKTQISWSSNYTQARNQAIEKKKRLFVYLTAPYCSICSAIEKNVLSKTVACHALDQFVLVKLDVSNTSDTHIKAMQEQYKVVGVPTYLLIDPTDERLIQRWGGELYSMSSETFAQNLTQANK